MRLNVNTLDGYKLLHQGALALAQVETNGIRINTKYCIKMKSKLNQEMKDIEADLQGTPLYKAMVWAAGKQKTTVKLSKDNLLRMALFRKMGLASTKTTDGGSESTDAEALRSLIGEVPELEKLLRWKKLEKAVGTYFAQFIREERDGYLHPFFNLAFIPTYRSSSNDPNFQNQPKREKEIRKIVRRAIVPRPGNRILEFDMSGAEVNVATCYHKDPTMIEYVTDDTKDMHRDMAMECFALSKKEMNDEVRHLGKNDFVFPQFYGDYFKPCAANMWKDAQDVKTKSGIPLRKHLASKEMNSLALFEHHIEKVEKAFWHDRFPIYTQWKDEVWEFYQKYGYVDLYTGFRCTDITQRNKVINRPIQGSAFHCLLWSLIKTQKLITAKKMKSLIIGQVHDSMVMDVPEIEVDDIVYWGRKIMTEQIRKHWKWIIVPMKVDIEASRVDGNWYHMTKLGG